MKNINHITYKMYKHFKLKPPRKFTIEINLTKLQASVIQTTIALYDAAWTPNIIILTAHAMPPGHNERYKHRTEMLAPKHYKLRNNTAGFKHETGVRHTQFYCANYH